ncbi:ArsA-related P-loop ATPase [Bacteriovorax sp. Seq25_V]|uniref:ArsA-related P-loop ATPase n=1 Tax=Bacteriovorax sp. Seq25_V TaxID=1201288 RepID=UPI000389F23B|nr:ArsA-related P-loop ATPase [Bacteriovorax sp. Seq25_V]EQC47127.1 anion-transporting ATPase domain protein [Bacteriovorax sp. Seq25_V]
MSFKRLYIVTGKGGVGKSLTALSLSKLIAKNSSKKVLFNSFDADINHELCHDLGVTPIQLKMESSATEYIGRKLGSETIAKWIMKAPFFKALFNIVPSLGNMILLGHLIDILEKDPELIIVVDAPSSGHILTVLESPINFEKIFKSGPLVSDIHRMTNFISNKELFEAVVVSIPTELAVTEGLELTQKLTDLKVTSQKMILNNVFSMAIQEEFGELPSFLESKIKSEKDILKERSKNYDLIVPMFINKDTKTLVSNIEESLAPLFNEGET